MKKIGLIGGITWQSTQLYYHYLNTLVAERLGGQHSCPCIIESLDFAEVSAKQAKGQWGYLHALMAKRAVALERAGAEVLLICANTMHLSAPAIMAKTNMPLVHIAEVTGQAAQEQGCKKVLLLGTKYTMELDFYRNILENQYQIEVLLPNVADRQVVHDTIYNELAKGIIHPTSKTKYLDIIEKAEKEGADGVILGCTEIPLLIQQADCTLPVFDTTKIHATAAVTWALAQK
jgi:aspartate racemase